MHTYVFFLDKRRFCFSAPEPGSHGSLLKGVFPPTVTKCSDVLDCLCDRGVFTLKCAEATAVVIWSYVNKIRLNKMNSPTISDFIILIFRVFLLLKVVFINVNI